MQASMKDLESSGIAQSVVLLEKADQAIMAQKWDFVSDLIKTVLEEDPINILALEYQLLEILITSGDTVKAGEVLN